MAVAPSTSSFPFLRRRWRTIVVVAAAILFVCVIADAVVGSMYRSRIAAAVRQGFGAELKTSGAWYLPPGGVSLRGVRLLKTTAVSGPAEIFRASRLDLKLERVKGQSGSEKYRIRYAKVWGGRFRYAAPGQEAVVLEPINVEISPFGDTQKLYHFFVDAEAKNISPVRGAGSIDVDQRQISVADLSLRIKVDVALSHFPLSDSVRRKLDQCEVGGTFDIRGSVSMPAGNWRAARYKADVQLSSGKFASRGGRINADRIEAEVAIGGEPQKGLHVDIHKFQAMEGSTMLVLDGGKLDTSKDSADWRLTELLGRLDIGGGVAALDRVKLHGRVNFTGAAGGPMRLPRAPDPLIVASHELVAYPVDVSIQPPKYPRPVDHINGGPIRFHGGVVRFENLNANYGGDKVILDDAHITLDDPRQNLALADLRRQIRVDGIIGTLLCRQPGPVYPAGLGKVIAQLRPTGSFAISGWYGINRKLPGEAKRPKADYFFRVSTAGGAFALTDHKAPLTDIRADATVSPMLIDITRLRGKTLGGELIASSQIAPVRPVHYQGNATFYNVNLEKAWNALGMPTKAPLLGTAYFKIRISGVGAGADISPLRSIAANGEFEVVDGNFGDITALRAAARSVSKPQQTLDGQAAGVFSVRDETVTLSNCAVGNPLYGLQGSGDIGFNEMVDLHVVAAPLGDWRMALKQTNVPILANAAGIAGSIQKLFDGAQRALLYDVHITGPATHPTVAAPTLMPVISGPIAAIFGQLIGGAKDVRLIDQLRPRTAPQTQEAQTAQIDFPKSK
ncbi:MAG TPA: AsmA-like C-terminal region-containing protein [Tepidisphaeraceae bacterium]|nr:AsmA-like C-terminal region-containing protein [Tepidisphaeraceae bacterium]